MTTGVVTCMVIGSGHLLSAGRRESPPDEAEVSRMITAVVGPSLR